MLARKVQIHDIRDAEAFVIECIKRSGVPAPPRDWEELAAEGLCILLEMEKRYKPRLAGYGKDGCFSGYAIKWLPKLIGRAWHKSQQNHLYVKQSDGKRKWEARVNPLSWEYITRDVEVRPTDRPNPPPLGSSGCE